MPTLLIQKRHNSRLSALAWSPDGTLIVSGGYSDPKRKQSAPVVIWDAMSGERCASYRGLPMGAESLAWSPDGRCIAAVGWDAAIQVWEWHTNQNRFRHAYVESSWPNAYLAWSPDGHWLATAGRGTEITIWDTSVWQAEHTYTAHGQSGSGFFAWSPDGRRVASSGYDGTVRVWESATAQTLWTTRRESRELAWSPDARYLALAREEAVDIYDMRTFTLARRLEASSISRSPALAWSPTGRHLAVDESYGNRLHLWDPATGQHLCAWTVRWSGGFTWSPDGSRLVCGCGMNTAEVWQVA